MLRRLKIELRHKQLFEKNDPTKPILVQCNSDGTTEYIPGFVPNPGFVDVTEDVENLDEFEVSWQAATTTGATDGGNEFGSNYAKGVSSDLVFQGAAFQFIYDWLMTEPCQLLNCIEAKITDMDCGKAYRLFELKLENTDYSPDDPCIVQMALREKDDAWHAFTTSTIEDNWQNWFNKDGNSTKDHPTFLYVVEKKPKFFLTILVVVAYMAGILSVGILIAFTEGKHWIRKLLGICYFCPSPLIRTYIENICSKYGYTHDTIFDNLPTNVYRNVCLFYPVERSYQEFEDYVADSTKFIWDNRTGLPVNRFLDSLKVLFNCEWYVTPNKQLIFKRRSFFDNQPPIIDFSNGSIKHQKLKYTFSGKKKPAYGSYNYKLDPGDLCTNEIKWRYNALVDFDGKASNPMLEGNITEQFDFAMTAFNRDGTTEPYFESAINIGRIIAIVAVVAGLAEILAGTGGLTVFIAVGLISVGYAITNGFINDFKNVEVLSGAVRLSNNNCNEPRLLIWDDTTPLNCAKVVSVVNPAVNPRYNATGNSYYQEHPTLDEPGLFGGEITKVYNYPLYIDEEFKGNLYDYSLEHENPIFNTEIPQEWSIEVQNCCELLDLLGVWEGDFAKIGAVVILERRGNRLIKGRIKSFSPKYKEGVITLQGTVLK
jgi:hypothetical protein